MTQNHASEAASRIGNDVLCEPSYANSQARREVIVQSAIDAATAEKDQRIATLESTLAEAAAKLQNVVTIGQVKHIGLRQVPGAIDMLIAEKAAEIAALTKDLADCRAALKPFAAYWDQLVAAERNPSESVVPLPPGPEDYRAAAEALNQIGATDER